MVSLPLVVLYEITTEVTSAACLGKNPIAFGSGKPPSGYPILPFDLALTPRLTKQTQTLDEIGRGFKTIGCGGFSQGTPIQGCGTKCSVISVPAVPLRVCDQIVWGLRG